MIANYNYKSIMTAVNLMNRVIDSYTGHKTNQRVEEDVYNLKVSLINFGTMAAVDSVQLSQDELKSLHNAFRTVCVDGFYND